MALQKKVILILFCFLYGCSDYISGYREGYGGSDKKQWIVFGRGDYLKGFHSGQAEKFQDDWLLENPVEESLMECPSVVLRADPLMFLPAEYKKIATDIYIH
jgi:hypothetical protein